MLKRKGLIFKFILIAGVIMFSVYASGIFITPRFDAEKWKRADLNNENNWSLRWDMMNSLRYHHELIGMDKNEILDLLGNPDSQTQSTYSYYLGYSKRGINTGQLTIKFNNKNKVIIHIVNQG